MTSSIAEKNDDLELLRLFAERGDRAALGALFSRYADPAYRFALRLCGRPADAEDAIQSAFLEICRHAANFRGDSSVKTWILGFVLNACRSKAREETRRRSRQERAATVKESSAAGGEAIDQETADQVREAVEELPEHYRSPVWLHYAEGLSPAEVGAVLNLPADTVRKQLSRGIDRLREVLLPAGAAGSVVAVLATLAVETAPPTLSASLAGIASGAAPAAAIKVGIASKIAATAVAAIALASTAGLLWWGIRLDERRPPDIAEIERIVREWQPTPEERRFDEIGWAPDLRGALRLSKESGRPVFLLTQSGRINLGRSDGGSQFLRGHALSDARVISALNSSFVPVYLSNVDFEEFGSAAPEERKLRDRIWADARKLKLPSGMDGIYLLDPESGRVLASSDLGKASPEALLAMLDGQRKTPPGKALVPPSSQSIPQASAPGALTLHLTARYLDGEGRVEKDRGDFHEFPAEDWVTLSSDEWRNLLPAEGESRRVDAAVALRLLTLFHPPDMSVTSDPDGRNSFEEASLRVSRFSRTYVRIEGRLKMQRSFTQFAKTPPLPIDAVVKGFIEIEPDRSRIRSLRIISEGGRYGNNNFGVAIRSTP
ncbi:MAG TPA: sigma-70 family RNA polymerase sigma factor [Planctomycetota bacterium]|jgi:RNA polymerase sigma-70 factor (ECF subfamily)|nr:sigma-70 family RNA polymerase sigma factor [Planctomycetota bacterium]